MVQCFQAKKGVFLWHIDIKEILANGLLDPCHKKDLSQVTVKDASWKQQESVGKHFIIIS